jgi:hypothetical protein
LLFAPVCFKTSSKSFSEISIVVFMLLINNKSASIASHYCIPLCEKPIRENEENGSMFKNSAGEYSWFGIEALSAQATTKQCGPPVGCWNYDLAGLPLSSGNLNLTSVNSSKHPGLPDSCFGFPHKSIFLP